MELFTIRLLFSSIPAVCFPRGGSALCSQVLPVRTPRPVRRFIALSALPAGAPGHLVLQRYELFGALTKVAAFAAGSSRWCRIVFHTGSPAERQLFRTDFRFAPSPRRASLAVPPIHEGHGRPRSVRKSSRLRGKCLSTDCICSDRRKSVGPSAPIAYATSISPPDEAVAWPGSRCWVLDKAATWWVRRSCKSPSTPSKHKHLIHR